MNLQSLKDQLDKARQENCLIRHALCDRVEMDFLDMLAFDGDRDVQPVPSSGQVLFQVSDERSSTLVDSIPKAS